MTYVQGFLLPVKTDKKTSYREIAEKSWALFKEYGATSFCEGWGSDVPEGEVTSFPMAVKKQDDETVVFSWIVWPDKASCDACLATMNEDPRWADFMTHFEGVVDMKRVIFGGFEPLVFQTA